MQFYHGQRVSMWISEQDVWADVRVRAPMLQRAMAQMIDFTAENRAAGLSDEIIWEPGPCSPNVLEDIPRDDPTWLSLSSNPVPHKFVPGLWLLKYCTPGGAVAYQPCSVLFDRLEISNALTPSERDGDHVFRLARKWSCVVQGLPDLPKDIRWALVMIYDLAINMLRPGVDEDTLWAMRWWLWFWYEVVDQLFCTFQIPATSPETQWFLHPSETVDEPNLTDEYLAHLTEFDTDSVNSSDRETVVHHRRYEASRRTQYSSQAGSNETLTYVMGASMEQSVPLPVDLADEGDLARSSPPDVADENKPGSPWSLLNPEALEFFPTPATSVEGSDIDAESDVAE